MLSLAFLPLAAVLPEKPGLLESLGYQLNGIIVVFLALASIWLLLEIIGRFFKRSPTLEAPKIAAAAATPALGPASVPVIPPGLAPEMVAAILAAVHVTLGRNARVAQIVPVMTNTWARDGRRQIFSSHQPR